MESLIIVIMCLVLPCTILINPIYKGIKSNKKIIEILKENKFELILVLILIVGSLVRIIGIDKMPNALNVDEASAGYDALSIMKYGIDRNGNSYPVFLYAWGSGQNALYSYILIPFMSVLGNTEFSLRLPMAMLGISSLYVMYYLIKNIFENKKIALIGAIFLAICPWHLMKSRWALESNLFPDLILIAVLIFILGLKNKNTKLKVLSAVILGISAYSYSTSYIFLPIFVVITFVYLIKKKQISIKEAILYLGIIFVVSLPIILYVIINMFDLNQIEILGITIPKLKVNRYEEASTIFSGDIIENCFENLKNLILLLITQNDKLNWSALPIHGIFYFMSLPCLIIGVIVSKKKYSKNIFNQIMNIWMISAVIVSAFCLVNVNRVNIIMFPCIYYIILGIYYLINKSKIVCGIVTVLYIISFSLFVYDYCKQDFNQYMTFTSGIEEISKYCESTSCDNIYCSYSFKEPYIYFLWYQKYNANDYVNTVEYFDDKGTFENVKSFGKYKFYLPQVINENDVVIVPKNSNIQYDKIYKNKFTINQFDIYEY